MGWKSRAVFESKAQSQGRVRWAKARNAAEMVVKIVQEGRIARRAMLFAGPPSTKCCYCIRCSADARSRCTLYDDSHQRDISRY
ncbi:hypothetical protein IW262DRAFT_537696 [Armillaria fumosa]|nr:hypothetical protein IW262DRAFT_537696 [Armillaria fumosa]